MRSKKLSKKQIQKYHINSIYFRWKLVIIFLPYTTSDNDSNFQSSSGISSIFTCIVLHFLYPFNRFLSSTFILPLILSLLSNVQNAILFWGSLLIIAVYFFPIFRSFFMSSGKNSLHFELKSFSFIGSSFFACIVLRRLMISFFNVLFSVLNFWKSFSKSSSVGLLMMRKCQSVGNHSIVTGNFLGL